MTAKTRIDELFSTMGETRGGPDTAVTEVRRAQIVGRMRRLHVELVHERGRFRDRRRRVSVLLVAAAVVAAGTAFAGIAGMGPLGRVLGSRPASEQGVAPALEARPSEHRASAAVVTPSEPTARSSEGALALAPAPRATATEPRAARVDVEPSPGRTHAVARESAREKEGQLEAVNRLFSEARRAKREGRTTEALALLEQLLQRYPSSVLAQEAAVERFRTLARLGRAAEARRHAASYLARHPAGCAAAEARTLLAEPASP
jgi:hypothetical protein